MGLDYELSSEAITPRATQLSEAMHRCLFEEAADGILVADGATARFLEANPRAEELTGYARDELLKMSMADLIAPESLVEQRLRWGVLRQDQVIFAERLIRRKDGSVFVAELSGRRLADGRVLGFLRDITQRLKLQTDLFVSEARYRSAVNVAPDAIAEVDLEGKLRMVSPATLRLFDVSDEQALLGRSALDFVAPEERARVLALLVRYLAGELLQPTQQVWLRRADGQSVLCEVSAAPVQDGVGAALSHALFARDITERSRTEAKIEHVSRLYALLSHVNQAVIRSRERQDLFQTVCDVAVEHGGFRMAWISVLDGQTQRIQPVAHAGHEADYLGELFAAATDRELEAGPVSKALRCGELVVCEDVATDPSMAPWRDAALARGYRTLAVVPLRVKGRAQAALTMYGDRVGFFSEDERRLMQELGEDISAALTFMEAQADQRRAELAVRASEERFRSLVQNSRDAIALHAASGIMLYASPAVERILGHSADELIGKRTFELIHPDDQPQALTDFETLLQSQGYCVQRDRRYLHRDGTYRWIESIATNLLHVPSVAAIVHNFRDVTERMRAEEERQELLTELSHAQKLDSIGRLAGGVAHDFNNMLAVILGSVELALGDQRTPTPIQGFLREIRDAAMRSAALTRQLLTFARKLPAEPQVLDVNGAVDGAVSLLRRLIGENLALHWRPGTDLWQIEMDPTQLGQILTNLTVNARDAISDVGSVTIETGNASFDEARCSQHVGALPGDYVRLSVTDTGLGISSEIQSHIFEPFFTTKGPGVGTGLGLATVYGIVKQYHGFIQLNSVAGVGTRFDIYLPRHVAQPSRPASPHKLAAAQTRNAASVLVVEDEPQVLSLVTTLLRNLGYHVVGVGRAQEALELVRDTRAQPDLLLTDVVMPGMNGVELVRALRGYRPELKSVFMSGYLSDARVNLDGDPSPILRKPFTLKALAEAVHAALGDQSEPRDGCSAQ